MVDCFEVLDNLKGRIISHPKEQNWRVQFHHDEAEFQYTLEHQAVKWSPLVSNLHMGHIQVKAYGQVPETIPDEDACTSALNLLQMVKEKRMKENKKKKQDEIMRLAMELKEKKSSVQNPKCNS